MKNNKLGRRTILKGATATAALMGAVRASFPAGAFAQAAGPETNKVTLGFIALTDAAPLIIAKEKKLFDKYGITDANIAKQASWGTTRDNMVLGSAAGGIDGAHILTPLALPDLARHHDGGEQADADVYPGAAQHQRVRRISVAKEFKGSRRQGRCFAAQGSLRQEEGGRQGSEVRHDLPRRHPRHVDPLLAGGGRHRSRQGRLDHRRAAAADGGQHEGRQHGRPSASASRGTTSSSTRTSATPPARPARSGRIIPRSRSACAPTGSTRIPRRPWPC